MTVRFLTGMLRGTTDGEYSAQKETLLLIDRIGRLRQVVDGSFNRDCPSTLLPPCRGQPRLPLRTFLDVESGKPSTVPSRPAGSLEQAVRTYFLPALETPSGSGFQRPPASLSPTPAAATAAKPSNPVAAAVKVSVEGVTYSPDRDRALAHVIFDNPSGTAYHSMVLQKRYGNWTLASVWLGSEIEKPMPALPDHKLTHAQAEANKTPPSQQSKQ